MNLRCAETILEKIKSDRRAMEKAKTFQKIENFIEKDKTTQFTRYFISSLVDIEEFADSVRKHWSIENQLHWCLDVIFREDASRARKDNSPLNMNILRKTALNLVSQSQYGRISKKKLMFKAALDPDLLLKILFFRKSKCCFRV